jgi:hypothetical protein
MMLCEYECHQVGGPWIAENPACPIHGTEAQQRDRDLDRLSERVKAADSVEELRALMLEMIAMMR